MGTEENVTPAGDHEPFHTAVSSAEPTGTPMPVQGSQPAAALYPPFPPRVMSRNPAFAAYRRDARSVSFRPLACWQQAMSAAQSGATALVPPRTNDEPSTTTL